MGSVPSPKKVFDKTVRNPLKKAVGIQQKAFDKLPKPPGFDKMPGMKGLPGFPGKGGGGLPGMEFFSRLPGARGIEDVMGGLPGFGKGTQLPGMGIPGLPWGGGQAPGARGPGGPDQSPGGGGINFPAVQPNPANPGPPQWDPQQGGGGTGRGVDLSVGEAGNPWGAPSRGQIPGFPSDNGSWGQISGIGGGGLSTTPLPSPAPPQFANPQGDRARQYARTGVVGPQQGAGGAGGGGGGDVRSRFLQALAAARGRGY